MVAGAAGRNAALALTRRPGGSRPSSRSGGSTSQPPSGRRGATERIVTSAGRSPGEETRTTRVPGAAVERTRFLTGASTYIVPSVASCFPRSLS